MDGLLQDLRHAARRLASSPGFTAVAAVILGLGIGANTTAFGVLNGLLLRPLPVREPARLAAVFTSGFSEGKYGGSSYPDYVDFRDGADAFAGLMAHAPQPLALSESGQMELVIGETVTGNYFDVLGVPAARGRTFLPEEDRTPGTHPVAVVSHRLWVRRFASDPALVGRSLTLNGQAFTVVGIAPEGFPGMMRGLATDVWIPMMMRPRVRPSEDLTNRGSRSLLVMGRLRDGADIVQARAQLEAIAGRLNAQYPGQWSDVQKHPRRVSVAPESEVRIHPVARGAVLGVTGLLGVVAGLVLLISCANVANLLLARTASRAQEVAIRLSLGASRARLLRQFLSESVLLAGLGGLLGVLMAVWATDLLSAFQPPLPVPVQLDVHLDLRVLAFGLVLALATGVLVGLAPALQASRPDLVPALKDEAALAGRSTRSRLRSAFVIAQVSLSFVLLVTAGLFLRSLRNASAIDPGFSAEKGLLLSVDLISSGHSAGQGRAFYEQLAARVRALPGVEAAAWTSSMPLSLEWMRRRVWPEGHSETPREDMEHAFAAVGPGYFETLGVGLARGRAFDERDRVGAPGVAIVNEAFARRYWPGQDAIGKRLSVEGPEGPYLEVVGLAREGKYFSLGEAPRPFFYLALPQNHIPSATLVVRTVADPTVLTKDLRRASADVDATVLVLGVKTLAQHVGFSLLPARAAGTALGLFGLLGLTLASLGIYAVVAYAAAQRTREVRIRMALGARPADILRLVLGGGMRLVGIGLGVGLAIAFAVTGLLRGLLYGLSPTDPATFGGVALLFAAIALVAGYLPARAAMRVDPAVTLRYE